MCPTKTHFGKKTKWPKQIDCWYNQATQHTESRGVTSQKDASAVVPYLSLGPTQLLYNASQHGFNASRNHEGRAEERRYRFVPSWPLLCPLPCTCAVSHKPRQVAYNNGRRTVEWRWEDVNQQRIRSTRSPVHIIFHVTADVAHQGTHRHGCGDIEQTVGCVPRLERAEWLAHEHRCCSAYSIHVARPNNPRAKKVSLVFEQQTAATEGDRDSTMYE